MLTSHSRSARALDFLSGWRDPEYRMACVLAGYFDDAGSLEDQVHTIGGLVAFRSDIEALEIRARALFDSDEYKVPYLHTVDFRQARGAFAGWTWEKRGRFADALMGIVYSLVQPIFVELSIERDAFTAAKATFPSSAWPLKHQRPPSHAVQCFYEAIMRLNKNQQFRNAIDGVSAGDGDLSIFFERGGASDALVAAAKEMRDDPAYEALRIIGADDPPKEKFISLQVADFIAHYSKRLRIQHKTGRRIEEEWRFVKNATMWAGGISEYVCSFDYLLSRRQVT